MLPFLTKANSKKEAPLDSYILYNLENGIYWLPTQQYYAFALQWFELSTPPALTMDLSSACFHSIILDFDCRLPLNNQLIIETLELIDSVLKTTFLSIVPNFTYILAMRAQQMGIHVHLPEFRIGYDDYILLCEFLQYKCRSVKMNDNYKLDILANAMLPGATKPDSPSCYRPVRIVYVNEKKPLYVNMVRFAKELDQLKKLFVKRKDNEKSVFKQILNFNPKYLETELKQYMMPVYPHVPIYNITYGTIIGNIPYNTSEMTDIACITFKNSSEMGYISKNKQLECTNYSTLSKVYNYLKLNGCNIDQFQTKNIALKRWRERLSYATSMDDSHIPEMFRDIHQMLVFHMASANNPNPIKTIMQDNDGYYFLPVFYALCKHYQKDSRFMVDQLKDLLDVQFHELLNRVREINPKIIQYVITDISLNTIHFCANNLGKRKPKTNRDKLQLIVKNNQRAILSVSNQNQMVNLIRSIQEQNIPIHVFKLKNSLKKPGRFIWNALSEVWQEVTISSEISDHIHNLWFHIKQCIHESGVSGGPDEDLLNKINVSTIVAAIQSDTSMERKDIQMDTHKWLLRLPDGVLDLLTGHIGGVVPEFYISERKINLEIPRPMMHALCNTSPVLIHLYHLLTSRLFFQKYLKALFLNATDNLLDTLRNLVLENETTRDIFTQSQKDIAISMLHFYVNLCKCTCFEYELIMYMLDILSSVFIATNYERKFFVWKGITRNGKSKFLELMGRVLGGYYHSIESENLTSKHSSNGNATPELASTLFSCRLVCSEELDKNVDENRVKKITGNNIVAFRNMYEQNAGGIPMAKMFATTNNYPDCKGTEAFKDRVVAIHFDAEFVDKAPDTTKEQLIKNTFQKDVYVVEQSFKGCFYILYYHLKKHMNMNDGLLHYRDEPECVVEYTKDYLIHTDIYEQFKKTMDIQLMSGHNTTVTDVKSAIRQYLKTTKNTAFNETELFLRFQKEFLSLQRTDINLGHSESYTMDDEEEEANDGPKEDKVAFTSVLNDINEEEPKCKKRKTQMNDNDLIYYEGVMIKNLKRTNLDY